MSHKYIQVDGRIGSTNKPISTSYQHHQYETIKSSNDSLDTMSLTSKKPPPRPPSPSPFKTQKYQQQQQQHQQHSADVTDDAGTEIDVFEHEPQRYEINRWQQPTIHTPTVTTTTTTASVAVAPSTSAETRTQRKSVSFDLSDNEYISVGAHDDPEPSMSDDIGELFLKQFSRENSHEENDGYEVPIKYPSGPNTRPTHQVKSILRSPSPSSKAPTVPSSLDRPLRTMYLPSPAASVTTAVVHTVAQPVSDDEIERENPFRMEFLGRKTKENIYEELDDSPNKTVQTKQQPQHDLKKENPVKVQASEYNLPKQRPKSTYDSTEYIEVLPKAHQSNDDLSLKPENIRLDSRVTSASAGSLLLDRPNLKPPLPPKPQKSGASIKSSTPIQSPSSSLPSTPAPTPTPPPPPPPAPPASAPLVIKQADLKENEALKTFQKEMLHGDLYEFIHDAQTNQITKIKQKSSSIPIAVAKQSASEQFLVEEKKTKDAPRLATFNPSNPLPPIPKSPKSPRVTPIPPYSKVLKRPTSVERPTVSPPPPPVNLKTLPSPENLTPIKTVDGTRVEILSTSTDDLRKFHHVEHQENAGEYSLVTEETHREILLQENEIRNAMLIESSENISVTSSRIPVRKAPQPPTASTSPSPSPSSQYHHGRQHSKNSSISSDVISQHTSSSSSGGASTATTAQVFPVTQILPVQYSHLPTPQQPDYFLAFPSTSPSCNVISMPQPGGFSTFMVSDNSVAQTANIPTNIMYRSQQMHPMYLQRQFISVPISTAVHSINQSEPNVPEQNFVNMHANVSSAQAPMPPPPPPPSSSLSNNIGHTFDVYQSDYYQHQQQNFQPQQQQQQQQPNQQYHFQTQSMSPTQSSAYKPFSQSAYFDSKTSHSEYQMHGDITNSQSNIDSSSFPSMTLVDSQQIANNQNNNNNHTTDISIQSTESLTTISNLSTNYRNRNVCDELPPEPKPSFTTFGKQTQV